MFRCAQIKIQHLPENKWKAGTELSQNGKAKILNQELITVEKIINGKSEDQYFIGINYRDFKVELKIINVLCCNSM